MTQQVTKRTKLLLNREEVMETVALSKTSIFHQIKAGTVPKPAFRAKSFRRGGSGRQFWTVESIEAWIKSLPVAKDW